MQLLNAWYAVAHTSSLKSTCPLGIRLHGQRFAVWRDRSGHPAAVLDRCPHKGASLSAGKLVDGALTCGYHGWCFDRHGACLVIPALESGETFPSRAHTHAVPCREEHGFVWLWWGREGHVSNLNPERLPPLPGVAPLPAAADDAWHCIEGEAVWQANWLRAMEAFMDLTHVHFVHSGGFGANAPAQLMPAEQWVNGDSLYARVEAPLSQGKTATPWSGLRSLLMHEERSSGETADRLSQKVGSQHFQVWLANVSLIRIVFGRFQLTLCTAHVPVDRDRTVNLWRHYRSVLGTGLADPYVRSNVDRFMAEDQHIVETLTPIVPDLDGRDDVLLGSDTMTLAFRRLLRDRRRQGLLI